VVGIVVALEAADHNHRMEHVEVIVVATLTANADHCGFRVVNRIGIRGRIDGVVRNGLHHDLRRVLMAAYERQAKSKHTN
jgi:hypothetical protein